MTRDQFIAKHMDEMIGLLVGSFAQKGRTSHKMGEDSWAEDGKFMIAQMQRAKALLGRIWDDLQPAKGKP